MSRTEPVIDLNLVLAAETPVNAPQRVLIVGQKTTGTAPADVLIENIPNDGSEDALFGVDSMIAAQVRAFKAINKVSQVDVISLSDDGGGVQATGSIDFSGPSTAAGVFEIAIGSEINHTISLAIADNVTGSTVSTQLAAAVNALSDIPVTAVGDSPGAGNTLLTAINGGTEGNNIQLRCLCAIPGIDETITAMSGGATDPDTSATFTGGIPADVRYQQILVPSYALTDALDYLDSVFNVSNNILDGVAVSTLTGTLSTLKAINVALGAKHDSVLFGNKPVSIVDEYEGSAIIELNYVLSSIFGAIKALRLTDGAAISQFVQASDASLDSFGGAALASLPYHNTIMRNMPIVGTGLNWTSLEIDDLGTDGVSVFVNNDQKTAVVPRRVFVGFKNQAGINGFLNTTDTISQAREFFFAQYKLRFGQIRLTSGDEVQPGRASATKASIEAATDSIYVTLGTPAFALMRGDDDTIALFKQNRVVTLNFETGVVTIDMLIFPVGQLRTIRGTLQVSFQAVPAG